jgi:hypothetical protein
MKLTRDTRRVKPQRQSICDARGSNPSAGLPLHFGYVGFHRRLADVEIRLARRDTLCARAAWITLRTRGVASGIALPRNYLLMTAGQFEAGDSGLPAC